MTLLAEQIEAVALGLERGDSPPASSGRRLREIAEEVRRLLEPENNARVRKDLAEVKAKLGEPGASRRAAEAIMSTLKR